jgi:hypothetical protein
MDLRLRESIRAAMRVDGLAYTIPRNSPSESRHSWIAPGSSMLTGGSAISFENIHRCPFRTRRSAFFLSVIMRGLPGVKSAHGIVHLHPRPLQKSVTPSPRRKPGSSKPQKTWIPAFAGMTVKAFRKSLIGFKKDIGSIQGQKSHSRSPAWERNWTILPLISSSARFSRFRSLEV